ncbi:TetR/AcrR family transcriptional regulator [Mycolicibacterium sp. XJ1819]
MAMTKSAGEPPSMRSLATELTVTPGALYRHFDGQAELVTSMIDEVMDRVEMPDEDFEPDPWQRIRAHVLSLTSTLDAYPGLDQVVARHGDSSAAARVRQQWMLQQLRLAGLNRRDATRAYGALDMYWLGSRHRTERSAATFRFGLDRLIDGLAAHNS